MKYLILTWLFAASAEAYTLNNNFAASFKDHNVKVFIDSGTVCPVNQITVNDLESMINPAIEDYWNTIPTSSLKLTAGGFSQHLTNINDGRLCSPTDTTCINEGTTDGNLIPPAHDIVIACNSNPDNFGGGNVLAVTIPNKFSGKKIVGSIILINDSSNTFGNLSRADQIGVISHEIGHAIGLGHSEDKAALMYYRTVDQRKKLGQDDIDGINYLYPVLVDAFGLSDGLLGSCGSIDIDKKGPPSNPPLLFMGITLGLSILVYELLRLFKRTKARSAT